MHPSDALPSHIPSPCSYDLEAHLQSGEAPRLRGYGCDDLVPSRLLPHYQAKRFCREAAWQAWEPVAVRGGPTAHLHRASGISRSSGGRGRAESLDDPRRPRTDSHSLRSDDGDGRGDDRPRSRAGSQVGHDLFRDAARGWRQAGGPLPVPSAVQGFDFVMKLG